MFLESVQLLCSTFPNGEAPYKRTHYNHPSTVWARQSEENYLWLIHHAMGISKEYTKRYKKIHKCNAILGWCFENRSKLNLPKIGLTPFAMAMPEQYKDKKDPITSYRNYYIGEKANIAKWDKVTLPPSWWPNNIIKENK